MGLFDHSEEQESLQVNDTVKAYLLEAARWAVFLSIIGFIVCFLLSFAAIALAFSENGQATSQSENGISAIVCMLLSIFYFVPTLKLFKFGTKAKDSILSENQELFVTSLKQLRDMLKFVGIATVIMIIVYALIMLFALIVGGTAAIAS